MKWEGHWKGDGAFSISSFYMKVVTKPTIDDIIVGFISKHELPGVVGIDRFKSQADWYN